MSDELTPEKLRAAVLADKVKREEACLEAISAALQKYQCQLVAAPALTEDGRITAVARIVAKAE